MLCELEGIMNGQQFKRVYERKCEPLMKKYDLRKIELDVLFFLHSYESFDTAKDIVNQKCLSKAHVSKAIENLAERRFVMTSSNSQDRRCVHLSITTEADPILAEMESLWQELERCMYRNVSVDERTVFTSVLNKIARNIDKILGED